ncbi:YciI family protein [Streptosporangium saharense]|uniref:YciI family protein n=1 Tax=Streptosporangium saharense TaxID=1706840 RepID=UPI0034273A54
MRYLIVLRLNEQPQTPPPAELMEAIAKLGEEATGAGVLLDTAGLAPSAQGTRVELAGGRLSVTDGPFAETKELISYALYQVGSKEEAVEWAARFLRLHRDLWAGWEGEADVLRVLGPEDFAAPA